MTTARRVCFLSIGVWLGLAACDGGNPGEPVGAPCFDHSECASLLCGQDVCVEPCTADTDCSTTGGACAGRDSSTSRTYCVSECTGPWSLADDWYCADGVPTRCADGGAENDCSTCGCPVGERCQFGANACAPPAGVGEPCVDHADCVSRNCGRVAGDAPICFVAAGAACDGTNCGECVRHEDGSTECLQACDDSGTCGAAEEREMLCWGSEGSEAGYYCRDTCSEFDPASCPTGYRCRSIRDRDFRMYNRCYPLAIEQGPARHGCEGAGVADACGVCDADPTNDCVQDCAGTYGGSATMDMCGTCDTDPSNDCQQDCAGAWGGPAVLDPCGTCDADPRNDGNLDPCGVCDTDPTNDCVPRCDFGRQALGACWFVSDNGSSCSSKCSVSGGRYSEQTRRVAGSDGTTAACSEIVSLWQPSVTTTTRVTGGSGIGCAIQRPAVFGNPSYGRHHTDVATTASATAPGFLRLCACEF